MREYDHKKIEKKWQDTWEKKGIYHAEDKSKKPKYYSLIEFPYPSGSGLHVGHIRSNTAMDIISRKRRMEGFNVLYPIGWDAFGLPTENYAIKTGIHPIKVTKQNTDTFRKQLKMLGFSFDWSREINTTDPKYYKWTQWIFLQFFKKGLAYKKKTEINWCPKDKIGLANEEVVDGKCERCGSVTEKREKEQWMLAITKYADRLDKDLDTVNFLDKIKIQQRNWIGKSDGAEIDFEISSGQKIKVFTTRADTIFGVTFLAIAPEVAKKLAGKDFGIKIDLEKENKEKIGADTGLKAKNPANGEEIPIWVVNYVSADYGTGAVMGVPAHDERDFEFAKKYNLEIKYVIEPVFVGQREDDKPKLNMPFVGRPAVGAIVKHWSEDKFLVLDWKTVDWHTMITGGIEGEESPEDSARREILEETGFRNLKLVRKLPPCHSRFYHTPKGKNVFAHFQSFYFELENGEQDVIPKEEDLKHSFRWIERKDVLNILTPPGQKYLWNTLWKEIPSTESGILMNSGKFNGMDSEEAKKEIIKFIGGKEKTTYKLRDWVFSRQRYWGEPIPLINCEKCGWVPVPEKNLPVKLPNVKNYQPTDNGESPLANISKWVNVKCPNCKGKAKRETDTMPNWAGSSWYYLRYTDTKNNKEFASKKSLDYWVKNGVDWYNGGMEHTTLHLLYSRFWHKFLYDLKLVPTSEPYMKRTSHGLILAEGGEKMSKSKGNVTNPDDIVKIYGADTLRLYEMFMGPFDQSVAWNTDSLIGPRRFLERVWKIREKITNHSTDSVFKLLHKTIKKVSEDIESMNFNTAISSMMILATEMQNATSVSAKDFKIFLQILNPFAPHITEELWESLGEKKSISFSLWPEWYADAIKDKEVKIVIQINGKVRAEMMIGVNEKEEEIKAEALKNEAVLKHTEGKAIKRVIYVKNRLINIVF